MQKGWYSIKQIAQLTGLSTFVIRKWEERYGCIQPKRLENGYRAYSEEDLHLLISIKGLVDRGYTVKNALLTHAETPLNQKVLSMNSTEPFGERLATPSDLQKAEILVEQLLEAGGRCDDKQIRLLLNQALLMNGTSYLLQSIITPFLCRIGECLSTGVWSEHQEHIAALAVRDFVIHFHGAFQESEQAPCLLGACLPFEKHEIPLRLILLQAKLRGWKTVFLGASPAPGALEMAVKQLMPAKVVVTATTAIPFQEDPEALRKLEQLAEKFPQISFYLGGTGVQVAAYTQTVQRVIVANDIQEIVEFPKK